MKNNTGCRWKSDKRCSKKTCYNVTVITERGDTVKMLVIDRFEGEYALIQLNKRIFHIPKSLMPKGAKEGDVINIQISIDKETTQKQKKPLNNPAGSPSEK